MGKRICAEREAHLTAAILEEAYCQQGKTCDQIAREAGVAKETVRQRLLRARIAVRPREAYVRYRRLDVASFRTLTSDRYAYWVGFLAADGHIGMYEREQQGARGVKLDYVVAMKLSGKDAEHVYRFKRDLGADHPVRHTAYHGYTQARIELRDRGLIEALAMWGVGPHKALTLTFPHHLPASLVPAYVRGYFDGDGTVMVRDRVRWSEVVCRFISGSPTFLADLASTLGHNGITTGAIYLQGAHTHILPVSSKRENVRRFAAYLYTDATVWLPRKRTLLEEVA